MLRLGRGGGRSQRNTGSVVPTRDSREYAHSYPARFGKIVRTVLGYFQASLWEWGEDRCAWRADNSEIQENRLQLEACSISYVVPRWGAAVLRPYNPTARRFTNWGNHNIGFDRADNLGVASSSSSHIGSVKFSFFNCREDGRGAPRCRVVVRLGSGSFLSRGAWLAEESFAAQGW